MICIGKEEYQYPEQRNPLSILIVALAQLVDFTYYTIYKKEERREFKFNKTKICCIQVIKREKEAQNM